MTTFLMAWLVHAMGWFIAYGVGSAVSGKRPAPPFKPIVAYGLLSTCFQYLLIYYLGIAI